MIEVYQHVSVTVDQTLVDRNKNPTRDLSSDRNQLSWTRSLGSLEWLCIVKFVVVCTALDATVYPSDSDVSRTLIQGQVLSDSRLVYGKTARRLGYGRTRNSLACVEFVTIVIITRVLFLSIGLIKPSHVLRTVERSTEIPERPRVVSVFSVVTVFIIR